MLTNTTRTPGTVKNVTAAVFIAPRPAPAAAPGAAPAEAPKRTPEELAALRQVVINALGLKLVAGQSPDSLVTLQELPFAAEPVSQQIEAIHAENRLQGWVEAGSRWTAVIGAAIVLLIFTRMLGRQKPEPVPVEVLSMPPEMAARSLPSTGQVTPEMLNELIRAKPANIGGALREWVGTNSKN